jgi:hypothetical protein
LLIVLRRRHIAMLLRGDHAAIKPRKEGVVQTLNSYHVGS